VRVLPKRLRPLIESCPSSIIESVLVKQRVLLKRPARLGLVLDRLDPLDRWRSPGERVPPLGRLDLLDRWRSSVKKSPMESVLLDLDLFYVCVLDLSWTRFLTPKVPLMPKRLGPLKRILPILDCRRGPVERVLRVLDSSWAAEQCRPVERVLHVLDSLWTHVGSLGPFGSSKESRWTSFARLRPMKASALPKRLGPLNRVLPSWTVESVRPLKRSTRLGPVLRVLPAKVSYSASESVLYILFCIGPPKVSVLPKVIASIFLR